MTAYSTLMQISVKSTRSDSCAMGCPSVATAMARQANTTSVTPAHTHRSKRESRPCRCRFRMVRFMSDDAGTKNARFTNTAWVIPIVRNCVTY